MARSDATTRSNKSWPMQGGRPGWKTWTNARRRGQISNLWLNLEHHSAAFEWCHCSLVLCELELGSKLSSSLLVTWQYRHKYCDVLKFSVKPPIVWEPKLSPAMQNTVAFTMFPWIFSPFVSSSRRSDITGENTFSWPKFLKLATCCQLWIDEKDQSLLG